MTLALSETGTLSSVSDCGLTFEKSENGVLHELGKMAKNSKFEEE